MRTFPDNIAPGSPKSRRQQALAKKVRAKEVRAKKARQLTSGAPRSIDSERVKRFFKKPWAIGVLLFLVIGGIVGGTNVWAWINTDGLPREYSIVVNREDTGETERCGRRSWSRREPVYEVTYKSFAPPEGRAELFTQFEGCGARNIGDTEMIVRSFDYNGNYRVWFIHPDTLFDALWPGVLAGIGAGAFGAGVAYLAKRTSETRRGKHGAGPGKH